MDKQEIKEIIDLTINELRRSHMLKETSDAIYVEMSERLTKYFRGGQDEKLKSALHEFSEDLYIDIIHMYYDEGLTIERIAEELNVDVSTVTRNKKRLCLSLYNLIDY